MLLPAETGLGAPLLVTARSHLSTRGVLTAVLLLARLGSCVFGVCDTEDVAVIVPAATVEATLNTTIMSAEVPDAMLAASVQVTDGDVVHDQPVGAETDTNVVLAGMFSVKETPDAEE